MEIYIKLYLYIYIYNIQANAFSLFKY